MPRILVVGCGFVGTAAADLFHAQGWTVAAWTHSTESAGRLSSEKPYAVAAHDITDADAIQTAAELLPGGVAPDVVIDCVSSGRGGGAEQYRRVYLEGARHLLGALRPTRFIFTGSTSVYAQVDGTWVDETSPAAPDRETGRILCGTEELVLAAPGGMVARLAGIYGPGRSALLRKFLAGEALIEGDGTRWLNQIHRDDAAAALFRLAQPDAAPGIYNAADDTPLAQFDLYHGLALLHGLPLPPTGPIDLHRKRGWTNKRVDNSRLCALGWRPAYPSFLDWAREEKSR